MFSLITVILAVALVAALAVATIWLGGSHFTDARKTAAAARVINEGQQIVGAINYYRVSNQGSMPGTLNDLVAGNYLRVLPNSGNAWQIIDNYVITSGLSEDDCKEANQKVGYNWTSVPSCSDPGIAGKTLCCQG
jgi:type II secretory pathway pseudopilin PulG